MICFYNVSARELFDRSIKLTKNESKLLNLLLNNNVVTFEELRNHFKSENNARNIKNRIMKKTYLNITTIVGLGYRLDSDIYVI